MKITVSVKDKNKKLESINRAEELIKELKAIFTWDLDREIELEMEEPSAGTDGSEEIK